MQRSGPERRNDAAGARAPVVADDDGTVDLEGAEQRDLVECHCRLLRGAGVGTVEKARGAMAAQVRHDHPAATGREQRRDFGIAVDVVGVAVHQQHRNAVGRAGFVVADIEFASLDLADGLELARPCSGRGIGRVGSAAHECQLDGREAGGGAAQQEAALTVDGFFGHGTFLRLYWRRND
jgi:hypothetical protein